MIQWYYYCYISNSIQVCNTFSCLPQHYTSRCLTKLFNLNRCLGDEVEEYYIYLDRWQVLNYCRTRCLQLCSWHVIEGRSSCVDQLSCLFKFELYCNNCQISPTPYDRSIYCNLCLHQDNFYTQSENKATKLYIYILQTDWFGQNKQPKKTCK